MHDTPAFSPLYQQIKTLLIERLQAGEWRPGEVIPSEMELAARFKVSQGTVRKAVDELAADNLLVRRQGKGTFVATHSEQQVQYRFLRLIPDAGSLESQGAAQRQVLHCGKEKASTEVAQLLSLPAGESAMHARRLLSFLGVPTILEDLWLAADVFKTLSAQQLLEFPGSSYALYEAQFGVRMVRAEEKIRALVADAEVAQHLRVAVGTPLLSVDRVAYTYKNQAMELRRALYRTDAHHYRSDLN
jgi:GntR family transcriptional regulator